MTSSDEIPPELEPSLPDQGPAEKPKLYTPTREQLVTPPFDLRGKALSAWLAQDLIDAIGAEFIAGPDDIQLYVKKLKPSAPLPEVKPALPPTIAAQGELF